MRSATRSARSVLPDAVGPTMANIVCDTAIRYHAGVQEHPLPLPRPYATPAAAVAAEVARLAIVVRRARPDERRNGDADRVLSRLEHPADRAPETVDAEADRLTARLEQRQKEL